MTEIHCIISSKLLIEEPLLSLRSPASPVYPITTVCPQSETSAPSVCASIISFLYWWHGEPGPLLSSPSYLCHREGCLSVRCSLAPLRSCFPVGLLSAAAQSDHSTATVSDTPLDHISICHTGATDQKKINSPYTAPLTDTKCVSQMAPCSFKRGAL